MSKHTQGFSLVELMVAVLISIVILAGVGTAFLSQRQVKISADTQSQLQNSENAISAILGPAIRGAGFAGCESLGPQSASLIKNPSAKLYNFQSAVFGYDANNTAGSGSFATASDNAANDITAGHWTPVLDSTLTAPVGGWVERGSDVLIVMGAIPGALPLPVTAFSTSSTTLTVQANAVNQFTNVIPAVAAGSIGALSDCGKAHVFQITSVSGATLFFAPNVGSPGNTATIPAAFTYKAGAQFIPMVQTVFFVGKGTGTQSSLYKAIMINGAWAPKQELVPGIENMQILYGVGASGNNTKWVPAGSVTDWTVVNAIQLAFLVEGGPSANAAGLSQTDGGVLAGCSGWALLRTCVTVPSDGQLRHVYTMTVTIRNAQL
ncbi:MAG: Type fimbrial biosis PilW related protein transrane [Verrucomicrobiaceae bacterium]|nr:Type fimbrial biosis PilW related protein transrane [Verrucomicrobiaceae bacterium]